MKVYELTQKGFEEAIKIVNDIKQRKVNVSIKGDMVQTKVEDALIKYKPMPKLLEIISQIDKQGFYMHDTGRTTNPDIKIEIKRNGNIEKIQSRSKGMPIISKKNTGTEIIESKASIVLPNGQLCSINKELILGRDKFQDIISYDKTIKISSNHIRIWEFKGEYYIEDGYRGRPSTNGTFLNSIAIKGKGAQKLNDGDIISLGNVAEIRLQLSNASDNPVADVKCSKTRTRVHVPTLKLFWWDKKRTWFITSELVLGRNDMKGFLIKDELETISTKHCRIFKDGNNFYIEDGYNGKSSTNGTKLGSVDITNKGKQILKKNSIITLADIVILEVIGIDV